MRKMRFLSMAALLALSAVDSGDFVDSMAMHSGSKSPVLTSPPLRACLHWLPGLLLITTPYVALLLAPGPPPDTNVTVRTFLRTQMT